MNKLLAKNLKKIREEAKISQNKLATKSKVSVAFISKLEAGEYKTISLKVCQQIAKGLGLTLKQFLDKIGLLENGDSPPNTTELIQHALRGKGLSVDEAQKVVDYAEYVIKHHTVGKSK